MQIKFFTPIYSYINASVFFCRTYKCLRHSETLDLELLSDLTCMNDHDCANELSGMKCTNYSRGSLMKYCNCPPGYAYNTNECSCKPAELCWENSVS